MRSTPPWSVTAGDRARTARALQLHLDDAFFVIGLDQNEVTAVFADGLGHQLDELEERGRRASSSSASSDAVALASPDPRIDVGRRSARCLGPCHHALAAGSSTRSHSLHGLRIRPCSSSFSPLVTGPALADVKQLAPVGPNGEALMDYTALAAAACGFDEAVVVVREEIRDDIERHVRRRWPSSLPATFVCQPPVPGTAQAVATAAPALGGPFGVGERRRPLWRGCASRRSMITSSTSEDPADRRRPPPRRLPTRANGPHLGDRQARHLRADRGRTPRSASSSTRSRCATTEASTPSRSANTEGRTKGARILSGSEPTSMNLWGFHDRMLDHLKMASTPERNSLICGELLLSMSSANSSTPALTTSELSTPMPAASA